MHDDAIHMKVGIFAKKDTPIWPELNGIRLSTIEEVAVVEAGCQSGRCSVGIRITLPNGKAAIIETTGVLMIALAQVCEGVNARAEKDAKRKEELN